MAFAFQGFGLGEYFKAQQRLTDILELYFRGVFDAPAAFLQLGRSLEDLSDEIDHLFDENSNRNSAILRSDNRLNVQQMLRVASHGVLDVVHEFENLLQVTEACRESKYACRDTFIKVQGSETGQQIVLLNDKFGFQTWKLQLFFRITRKSKIQELLPVLGRSREVLGTLLEQQLKRNESSNKGREGPAPSHRKGHGRGKSMVGQQPPGIIQRLQDSCRFEGSYFSWNLKAETTLLVVLHWLYTTKLGITRSRNHEEISATAYVNLIKTAWLLSVGCHSAGAIAFSEETRTLITMLSSELILIFKQLQDQGIRCPDTTTLLAEGDYNIFIESEFGGGQFGSRSLQYSGQGNQYVGLESPTFSVSEPQSWGTSSGGAPWPSSSRGGRPPEFDNHDDSEIDFPASSRDLYSRTVSPSSMGGGYSFSGANIETRTNFSTPSILGSESIASSSDLSSVGVSIPSKMTNQGKAAKLATLHLDLRNSPAERDSRAGGLQSPSIGVSYRGGTPRSDYSWNQKVSRQDLGLSLEELEIMPRQLPAINLFLSYTGDLHGRWDSCNVHLFRSNVESTLRLLAVKQDSFDQEFVSIDETELVPEYGYHEHEPVIYLKRRSKEKDPANLLFFRFLKSDDMFTFQSAFLNESVEAVFHAVRALRVKRSNVESYQKAGVQFWYEQSTDTINLKGHTAAANSLRSNATVKVHSTRIVMYLYHEKSMVMLFVTDSLELDSRESTCTARIRSSSHTLFGGSTLIKAQTLGTKDTPAGIPLNKFRLAAEDEDSFEDFKWFEIEFGTLDELKTFQELFRKALNLRRKARKQADDLLRLAAQGVRNTELNKRNT